MKVLKVALAAVAAAALYLLFWPTGIEPVAWTPPPAPKLEGIYAPNEILRDIQKLAVGAGVGPEGVNVDAVGRVYAGYEDGRVVEMAPDGSSFFRLADTGGRPLGITFGPNGGWVIADKRKGLLHLGRRITELPVSVAGPPLNFLNNADNTRLDKYIYFTDSSSKFGSSTKDLLEHGPNGRLLRYEMVTQKTELLLDGLHFPNGVAVGPDDAYVLVCETGEYRVLRYWLRGEKAGTHDVFIDNLPGFPDNISYNNRETFWLALAAPRNALLDRLLPEAGLMRTVLARSGPLARIGVPRKAFVLGLDLNGAVMANLQYDGSDAYAPITSVREHGPWLYFGSSSYPAIGRMPLILAVPGSPAPPEGWKTVPRAVLEPKQLGDGEEEEERERERSENPSQR